MARTKTLLIGMTLALLVAPADALAKGKKGKKGKAGKKGDDIQLTGFKSIDKVFKQISDIDARIDGAETALSSAKRNLNLALQLDKGTPLKDAIADLKVKGGDNLKLAMNGAIPKLTVADATPQNIADAANAVNGLTEALVTSIDDLAGIPGEVQELTKAVQKLPEKAKQEFSGDPIGALFKAPKLMKSIKGNAAITAALPSRSVDVSERAAGIVKLVSTEFTPGTTDGAQRGQDTQDDPRGGGRQANPRNPRRRLR